jgi:hypothetical protein
MVIRNVTLEDGRLDVFIIGQGGIPIARIDEPVNTGEEGLIAARAWMAERENSGLTETDLTVGEENTEEE